MKRCQGTLVLVIVLAWTAPAPAQLFAKKVKPNPSQRVPELILILKTDPDEKKRAHAAEEIRDYDAILFAEIVPVLVDVLQNDKKMSVRHEAVNSLAKIRPVNGMAAHALERAAGSDESWRVRLQAKTAITKYHLAGYSAKTELLPTASKKTTSEPPLTLPPPPASRPVVQQSPSTPRPLPLTPTSGPIARPLPMGPPNDPPPPLPTPTGPVTPGQGPSLFP